jgi:hypothetical protein
MAKENDGIVVLLDALVFNDKKIGYVSEDGIDWGGDAAEYIRIWAAQKRNAPVKKIKKKAATNVITFNLIELLPQNCADVMGGDVSGEKWNFPSDSVMLEGPLKILSGTGQTIEIYNVSLDGAIRGTLGGDDPLRIECEMEMELPASGGSPGCMYPTEPAISINPETLNFESSGGEKTATIDATGPFKVGTVPDGFTVEVKNNGTVVVKTEQNSGEQKSGSVEFTLQADSSKKATLNLSQSAGA